MAQNYHPESHSVLSSASRNQILHILPQIGNYARSGRWWWTIVTKNYPEILKDRTENIPGRPWLIHGYQSITTDKIWLHSKVYQSSIELLTQTLHEDVGLWMVWGTLQVVGRPKVSPSHLTFATWIPRSVWSLMERRIPIYTVRQWVLLWDNESWFQLWKDLVSLKRV